MSLQKLFDQLDNSVDLHNEFSVSWTIKGKGFGQFYFYEKDGVIHISNECTSKEFIKQVLAQMVDQAVLEDN